MIRRTAPAALAALLASTVLGACSKTVPVAGGIGEPCVQNGDCAAGFLCGAGRCLLPSNLGGCEPGRKRCNGADVEQCGDSGLGWSVLSSCATGCSGGACKPQVCSPGRTRCEGSASEQCTPAGDAWALVQICPSLCAADTGLCKAPVCTPFSTRCDPAGNPALSQSCDSSGATWQDQPCASGRICDGGRCQDVICAAGQTRCSGNGGSVESCNPKRDGWVDAQDCSIRCGVSGGVAACLAPVCDPGALRCSPLVSSALEQCLPDRSAWGFVTFCATGCTALAAGQASCAAPVCAPFARRCTASGDGVESCKADGSGFASTDSCPQGCAGGNCTTTSAGCSPGDLRCNGADAQACTQASPGVTRWQTSATCLHGCASGACQPGGSCGAVSLHAAVASAAGDGVSNLLVYSDVITGADGAVLPDGQEFTVAASAPSGSPQPAIVSADVDAGLPGVQVRSLGGRVHFTVHAPLLSAADVVVTATAQLAAGASCGASIALPFTAAASTTVLVAEDFTTTRARNLAIPNAADWSAASGGLIARFPGDAGSGEDGPLTVASGSVNLTSAGYAPAFGVLSLSGRTANLDGTALGLADGDEVLLWDVQGSASGFSNAGGYELLHVAAVSGTQLTFAEDLRNTYGAATDNDVALQHVALQRVPHFSALTVAPGAAVTASAWDGSKGGLLFLRVAGLAKIQGELRLDGAGFRGGRAGSYYGEDATGPVSQGGAGGGWYQGGGGYGTAGGGGSAPGQPYGTPLLGKLHLGGGGGGGNNSTAGGAGGGAIVVFAQQISLASDAGAQPGRVHADGQVGQGGQVTAGSGAGGSIWLSAPTIAFGSGGAGVVSAQGGAGNGGGAGGAGRVRIDYLATDGAGFGGGCSRAAPACAFGVAGALVGQSLDEYALTDAQRSAGLVIRSADLLLALGAPAGATYQASANAADAPDFSAPTSAPGHIIFGSSSPLTGPRFRFRVQLAPPAGAAQTLLGLQFAVTVN